MGISKRELGIVIVMLTGVVLAVLNQTLLSPALPAIMADMGVAQTTVQWLTSGYSLTEAVAISLSAYLIGRFSTRQLYVGGFVIFTAGSLLAALAPSFPLLLLGRVLQAACTGAVMPMVFTVILLIFPREKRGSAMGIISLVIGFAPAVGPSVSGLLVDSIGWRALFAVVTVLSLAVLIASAVLLRNYGEFSRTKLDLPSALLSALGLVCLLYGLSSLTSTANVLVNIALIAGGILILALYVHRQLKLPQPMLNVRILSTRRYATAVSGIVFLQAVLIGSGVIMPLYVQGVLGYSATVTGFLMLPGAVAGALMGFAAGKLFDRFGARRTLLPGSLLLCCAGICLIVLGDSSPLPLVCLAYTLLAVGLQYSTTPLNTWGVNSLDNSNIQHAQGVTNTLNQVAGSFGTAVFTLVSALGYLAVPAGSVLEQSAAGLHLSFICIAAFLFIPALIIVFLVREGRAQTQSSAQGAVSEDAPALTPQDGFGQEVLVHVGSAAGMYLPALHEASDLVSQWKVADVMNRDPHYVSAKATMRDAISLMASTDTSGIPVVDDELSVVGFISDGDVAKYVGRNDITVFGGTSGVVRLFDDGEAIERLVDLFELNVMDIATKNVICTKAGMPLDEATHLLAQRRIKKTPVTCNGKLVGTLSRRNIVHGLACAIDEIGV
ncbi:MAG: MDR family MFS transporter [Coriobacteriales bacterium]